MKKISSLLVIIAVIFGISLTGCSNNSALNTNLYGKWAQKNDSGENLLIYNHGNNVYYYNDEVLLKGLLLHMSINIQGKQ
ncbi:MAG: hypothetical protein LBH16_06525 [Treponema sp.]|jgi:hypothetical protein|nr:hypothetical protein [Treponema sp.]